MQESEILARIAEGDTDQFGLLYDVYAERIYRYIFYRTREQEVAEDLTSTTFFKAIQNIKRFDVKKGNFSSWIYSVARNTLFDYYRQKKITEPIEVADEMANSEDIEGEIGDRELVRGIKESFAQLTSEQREIVTMRIWDSLTYSEIAKALGKSESSCKVAFYRATLKLKKLAPLAMAFIVLFPSFNKLIK